MVLLLAALAGWLLLAAWLQSKVSVLRERQSEHLVSNPLNTYQHNTGPRFRFFFLFFSAVYNDCSIVTWATREIDVSSCFGSTAADALPLCRKSNLNSSNQKSGGRMSSEVKARLTDNKFKNRCGILSLHNDKLNAKSDLLPTGPSSQSQLLCFSGWMSQLNAQKNMDK